MPGYHFRGVLTIAASFVVALMLSALPMPAVAEPWRPAWVALVLIYWCMALPSHTGILTGWVVGLFLDVMSGALLGQHALALAVTAFISLKIYQQVRVLPLWQQGITIYGLVFVFQALVMWVNGIKGVPVTWSAYFVVPLISMLLWPWVFIVLRDTRRKFQLN